MGLRLQPYHALRYACPETNLAHPLDYPQYDSQLDTPGLDDSELEALDDLLHAVPGDAVMNIEALDGYLTALLVGPPILGKLKTAEWLPQVWGGDSSRAPSKDDGGIGDNMGSSEAAPFASQKQRKRAAFLVLRHLRDIQRQLAGPPEAWQPVFSIAESEHSNTGEWVDAEDWCAGFLQATGLAVEAWGELFDDASLGPALVPVALLGGDGADLTDADRARLQDPQQRDALSRAVVDAVLALHARQPPATH